MEYFLYKFMEWYGVAAFFALIHMFSVDSEH